MKRFASLIAVIAAIVTVSAPSASAWMITDVDNGLSQSVVDGTVFPAIERTNQYSNPITGEVYVKSTVDTQRVKTRNWVRTHCRFFFDFIGENTDKCGVDEPLPE